MPGVSAAAYLSLETVAVLDSGCVTFRPVPEDKELEVVYLAPELQRYGLITDKVYSGDWSPPPYMTASSARVKQSAKRGDLPSGSRIFILTCET